MQNQKHTPERWEQHPVYPDIILSNIPSEIDREGRAFVAESVPKKYRPLAIAAPELLDALESLAECYKQAIEDGGGWEAKDQPEYQKALAAIAKAKGEAK